MLAAHQNYLQLNKIIKAPSNFLKELGSRTAQAHVINLTDTKFTFIYREQSKDKCAVQEAENSNEQEEEEEEIFPKPSKTKGHNYKCTRDDPHCPSQFDLKDHFKKTQNQNPFETWCSRVVLEVVHLLFCRQWKFVATGRALVPSQLAK